MTTRLLRPPRSLTTTDFETTGVGLVESEEEADTAADDDTTTDCTTTAALQDPAASDSESTTAEDADTSVDTTTTAGLELEEEDESTTVSEEGGESESETTTADDTPAPRVDARGRPICAYCNCQPARNCANDACARSCVSLGSGGCERHGT